MGMPGELTYVALSWMSVGQWIRTRQLELRERLVRDGVGAELRQVGGCRGRGGTGLWQTAAVHRLAADGEAAVNKAAASEPRS